MGIQLIDISFRVGDFRMDDVSFEVPAGQYGVLMGRTGSGKSTLLEIITGLKRPSSGRVVVAGLDITRWSAADRAIGLRTPGRRAVHDDVGWGQHCLPATDSPFRIGRLSESRRGTRQAA